MDYNNGEGTTTSTIISHTFDIECCNPSSKKPTKFKKKKNGNAINGIYHEEGRTISENPLVQ